MDSSTRNISEDKNLWIENLTIDHIHPGWHVGAWPLNWREFDEEARVVEMLANAPIRLGVK